MGEMKITGSVRERPVNCAGRATCWDAACMVTQVTTPGNAKGVGPWDFPAEPLPRFRLLKVRGGGMPIHMQWIATRCFIESAPAM